MLRVSHAVAVVGTLVVAGGLVLTGGSASAAQKSVKDEASDATAAADITRVVVQNTDRVLSIRVKLSKPSAGRTHLVATLTPVTEGAPTYVVRTVVVAGKGQGKKVGATLESLAPGATESQPVECAGLKATISSGLRGQSLLRVPQTCLGEDAGTLVVDVTTVTATGDVADELTKSLRVKKG